MKTAQRACLTVLLAAGLADAANTKIYLAFDGYNGSIGGVDYSVPAFQASNLDANFTADDEAAMEQAIVSIVQNAFTDFRVSVLTNPPGPENYMVIALGSDSNGTLFGWVPSIDSDATDMDYGRIWAGSFKQYPAFKGIFSTVQRWANAVGETVAHEAGHNYGLDHWHAEPTPGEQALGVLASDHIMSTYPSVNEWQRANNGRVFSDRSYGVLAANVGLSQSLLLNGMWSNNNNAAAHDLHVVALSTSATMTLKQWNGLNPFTACQIVSLGTEAFQGQTYNKYRVDFSGGQVPSGVSITTSLSFDEQFAIWPDPSTYQATAWLVRDAYFTDAQGQPMAVRPRNITIQEHFEVEAGDFGIRLSNDTDKAMRIDNLRVLLNPRQVALEDMRYGNIPAGTGVWLSPIGSITLPPGASYELALGTMAEWLAGPFGPGGGGGGGDYGAPGGSCSSSDEAVFRGMFPSCYWTAEAEVTTLGAEIWDPHLGQFVIGDVTEPWVWQSAGLPVPEPGVLAVIWCAAVGLLPRRGRQVPGKKT